MNLDNFIFRVIVRQRLTRFKCKVYKQNICVFKKIFAKNCCYLYYCF